MTRDLSLRQALLPHSSLLGTAVLVLGGSWVIALAAQISVPMLPVPMTLQMLAILTIGFAFGARLGGITLLAYLAQGAMGLPVFANGMNGLAFAGPTAGFLIGFVGVAYLAGLAADRGLARTFPGTALSAVAISALLYIPGVAWPMAVASMFGIDASWVGLGADKIWQYFMAPFLLGDLVKAVIAALLVSGGWACLARRRG